MVDFIRVKTFKHSEASFCASLDEEGIGYQKQLTAPGQIMASGITINIVLGAAGVAAIAKIAIAWINARESRQISITTWEGGNVQLKGYSAKQVSKLMKDAMFINVIDTKPNDQ